MAYRRFDFGKTFGRTFSVLYSRLGTWVGICGIFMLPIVALAFGAGLYGYDKLWYFSNDSEDFHVGPTDDYWLIFYIGYVLFQALSHFIGAAIAYGVYEHLRGRSVGAFRCSKVALRRFPALLAIGLLHIVVTQAGAVFCFVPGLIFNVCWIIFWYSAVPALIVEDISLKDCFVRSNRLQEEYRSPILGIAFLLGIAGVIPFFLALALQEISPLILVVALVMVAGLNMLLPGLGMSVVYHDLRSAKETLDQTQLEDIFG